MSRLWRPFSAPLQSLPTRFVRGAGCRVTDSAGREYIDAAGGLWNVSLGLRNGELIERMRAQLEELSYSSLFHSTNAPAEQLCERLVALAGEPAHGVYLSTTGSSAVEVALRVARLHHRARGEPMKSGVISFDRAYHGSSLMGLSAGGILQADLHGDDKLPGFRQIPSPSNEGASLAALADLLARQGDEIGCFILEPVLGSAGVIVPSRRFCEAATALCRQHRVLVVADEVATGAGRCGAFLASSLLGLEPDVVALSKGINSGYFPLGCTIFSRDVIAPISAKGWALQFGSTQDGNPVGCVAALATLDQLERGRFCERAAALGSLITHQLRERTSPAVVPQIRGLGLMIGIELMHDDGRQTPFSAAESDEVKRQCQDEGLLTYHFESGLSLFPPLTIAEDDVHSMLDILVDVIGRLT